MSKNAQPKKQEKKMQQALTISNLRQSLGIKLKNELKFVQLNYK